MSDHREKELLAGEIASASRQNILQVVETVGVFQMATFHLVPWTVGETEGLDAIWCIFFPWPNSLTSFYESSTKESLNIIKDQSELQILTSS